jgi:hypothetical protein
MNALQVLTPELIAGVVAAAIALALDVVPGLSPRWEALPQEVKRFAWLIGCFLVGLVPWVLKCLADIEFGVAVVCTPEGLLDVLRIGFLAYFASQSVHGLYVLTTKVLKVYRLEGPADELPF